jgi:hypothetical protein
VPRHVERPDLGFAVDVPTSWIERPDGLCGGTRWLYCASSVGPHGFFVAFHTGAASTRQLADDRTAYLRGQGFTIKSVQTTVVDGHPAVRLHYLTKAAKPNTPAEDVEYDVIGSDNLVVGLIFGEPYPAPEPAIVKWATSTIRIL